MKLPMEETYEAIYAQCFPKLLAYLQQHGNSLHDAEDIAAQSMLVLWRKWETLPNHSQQDILRWLLVTARNLALKEAYRASRRIPTVSLEDRPSQCHPAAPSESSWLEQEKEYQQYLIELTRRLSPKEAELLLDKIERNKNDEEIAAKLGISVNAVRIRWFRIKAHIIKLMQSPQESQSTSRKKGER